MNLEIEMVNGLFMLKMAQSYLLPFMITEKEGFSLVKYPNGRIHYRGEYQNDKMIGLWSTYDEKGNLITEKDYGDRK